MKGFKIVCIIGACFVALGLIVLLVFSALIGWNWSTAADALSSNQSLEVRELTVTGTETLQIDSLTQNIIVKRSDDALLHLSYYEDDYESYSLEQTAEVVRLDCVTNGVQSLTHWIDELLHGLEEQTLTMLLPEGYEGTVSIASATGTIHISGLEFQNGLSVSTTTGDIQLNDCSGSMLYASATTGHLSFNTLRFTDEVCFSATTGRIALTDLQTDALHISATTGNVNGSNIHCKSLFADTRTGGMRFDALDTEKAELKTTTGAVQLDLSGGRQLYDLTLSTTTGDCNCQDRREDSARSVLVETTTGDITILFAE